MAIKAEQISMLPMLQDGEDADEIVRQVNLIIEHDKKKRKWENAFQKWSNAQWEDGYTSLGKCGYGSMCNYCKDNSYGRPCVRALNAMLRENRTHIDYDDYDFEKVW